MSVFNTNILKKINISFIVYFCHNQHSFNLNTFENISL